jgi:ubiquinone/menaquinone biosynthesis C-methylase UbiE/tetratricopeptide (TPR) repeat protein
MTTLETVASAEQWLDQAIAASAAGEFAKARTCLQNALDTDPQSGELILVAGHVKMGMNDLAGALDNYTLSERFLPDRAVAHSSRALALQLLRRTPEARQEAREALKLDKDDVVAKKVLARIFLDAQQHAETRQLCQQILAKNPDDNDAQTLLKCCQPDLPQISSQPGPIQWQPAAPNPPATQRSDQEIKHILRELLFKTGFRRLQRIGFHVQLKDYYSPLNDCDFLEANPDLWNRMETPTEIDWRLEEQLELAREIARSVPELRDVPINPPIDYSTYGWKNNFWENADAIVQYGLVRLRRPVRYVEIGCGWSSLLLKKALAQNAREGHSAQVTLIEPYPNSRIFAHLPTDWKVHRSILQRVPFEIFDELQAGDVLFYDGSHCSKVASDVNWFFFKILPRLKPGVIIHLHDISLPQEYPPPWIFERGQTWNEQYVLQAFLMHNQAYKILIANRYLFCHRQTELESLFQNIQPAYGSSFWMQKCQASDSPITVQHEHGQISKLKTSFEKELSPAAQTKQPFVSAKNFLRENGAALQASKIPDRFKMSGELMDGYSDRVKFWESLGPEHLLQQLVAGNFKNIIDTFSAPGLVDLGPDNFPVPPVNLTMGYGAGDLKHYLTCGYRSYEILTQLFKNHQVELRSGDKLLDWGCAAGRVVRNFTEEALDHCEIWGCDVHTPSIQWAQNHLSPPFRFFNSSSLPHLPFPENSFKLIYGLSVMTHLITLRDLWLLELRRVLKTDGCLILTIHNEDTWAWFRKHGMPNWMPADLRDLSQMPGECVEIRGSRWEHCYTFFHSNYVRRIWGRFLEVKEIVPCADSYQAAVIMKKATREIPPVAATLEQP